MYLKRHRRVLLTEYTVMAIALIELQHIIAVKHAISRSSHLENLALEAIKYYKRL